MAESTPRRRPRVERRATLDISKKDEMLAVLIRNLEAYNIVSSVLKPSHLRIVSDGHALVWQVVQHHQPTQILERGADARLFSRHCNVAGDLAGELAGHTDLDESTQQHVGMGGVALGRMSRWIDSNR